MGLQGRRRVRISDSDILRHVGARAMEAGRVYHRQGRIVSFEERPPEIEAQVRGSSPVPYRVRITVTPVEREGLRIKGECSCPVGAYCKHIAAALIESRARHPDVVATRQGQLFAAKPDSQAPAGESLPVHIFQWIAALERSQSSDSEVFPPDAQNRLLYVFSLPEYRHAPSHLLVEAVSARVLKNGGFSSSVSRPELSTLFSDTPPKYIRPSDVRITRLLSMARGTAYGAPIRLKDEAAWEIVEAALSTGRARLDSVQGAPLALGPDRTGKIAWTLGDDANLRPAVEIEVGLTPFLAAPSGYLDRASGVVGRLDLGIEPKIAAAVLAAPPVPARFAATVAGLIEQRAPRAAVARPASSEPPLRVEQSPIPVLRLLKADLPVEIPESLRIRRQLWNRPPPLETESVALARLSFRYGAAYVAHGEARPVVTTVAHGRVLEIVRMLPDEAAAVARLTAHGLANAGDVRLGTPARHEHDFLPEDDDFGWFDFLYHALPPLRDAGFVIEVDEDFPHRLLRGDGAFEIGLRDSSGFDWFELDLGVMIDGARVDLIGPICKLIASPFFDAAGYQPFEGDDEPIYLPLTDGRCLAMPAVRLMPIIQAIHDLSCAQALFDASGGGLRLSMGDAAALAVFEDVTLDAGVIFRGGEALREMGRKLKEIGGLPRRAPPADFAADLRPYQADGLSWLSFLREVGLGGILADDMGLGKTVQALALIAAEKSEGRLDKPALVIAPTSLMANWRLEAEKFAPNLNVLTLHGLDRKDRFAAIGESDLVLTTYPLIGRDKDVLKAQSWSLLILDEAQTIKNPDAATTRLIRELPARQRFALTGTPLENHLGELWSLFNVVSPGFLGDRAWFSHAFRTPIEKKGDKERARHLARRVKPFLLRRTKNQVASELPPKTEIVERIEMEREQRDIYESIRLAMHAKVRAAIAAKGLNRSRIIVLDALLKMRQACCDPRLLKLPAKNVAKAKSAKLERLDELLDELMEEDRRILIFSQFTSMLDLIRPRLDARKIGYSLLTGATKDRPKEIQAFQNGETKIFLISLKAGGVGLNLTAADTVILFDPWWNPAVEEQAIDRAHRIGQDKPVFVHKLVIAETIEEKMEEMKARKRQLAESLFDADGAPTLAMTESDIDMLFS
jgi:superfamily II DNA or RNA helicase